MKAKDINKAINWGLGFSAAYFIGTAIAGAIKKHRESGANGIGATRNKQKKFYVYAGYWENYISSKPMPSPYVKRRTFSNIDAVINYAEDLWDTVIYCDNVKYDLPDYMYESLQDEDYEYFRF